MRYLIFLIILIIALPLFSTSALAQTPTQVAEYNVIPCQPSICGGFPQNLATLNSSGGVVRVFSDGRIEIRIAAITDKGSSRPKVNAKLDLLFGSFTSGVANVTRLGQVKTDSNGNIQTSLTNFLTGGAHSGNFIFNRNCGKSPAIPKVSGGMKARR